MKYYAELSNIENEIVKLHELTNVVSVLYNGVGDASPEELQSAFLHIYNSIKTINRDLQISFDEMWEADKSSEIINDDKVSKKSK